MAVSNYSTQSSIDNDLLVRQAINEILSSYGDRVSVDQKKKSLLKFGQNESVGQTEATIMELAGSEVEETYATLGENPIDSLSCSDDSFDGDIYVEGHTDDGSGNLSFGSQIVTATGQTRAALSPPLARATRCECADDTAFSTPASDKIFIYENGDLTSGEPDTKSDVHLVMSASERQSKKASTAISINDYAIVTRIYADINKKTGAKCDVRLRVREIGAGQGRRPGGFKTKLIRTLDTSASSIFEFFPVPYIIIPKNSDIILTALASTTAVSVSGGFDSYLASILT